MTRPDPLFADVRGRFLVLWTKARECAGYDKKQWEALQTKLDELGERLRILHNDDPTQPGVKPKQGG